MLRRAAPVRLARGYSRAHGRAQNHYKVLGVSVNASQDQIKRRFYELSKQYHPDANKTADPEKYHAITTAYTTLSNRHERQKFDMTLGAAARQPEGYTAGTHRWQGVARHSFHSRPRQPAHQMRADARLDPLRPSGERQAAPAVPRFDGRSHYAAQQRADAHRENKARIEFEMMGGSMKPQAQTSPLAVAGGAIIFVSGLLYLLFR